MASITTSIQSTFEKSLVTEIMNKVFDNFSHEERLQVTPWISQIEEHAMQLIDNLKLRDTRRRKSDVLVTAAVYDAFLEYESRTNTRVRLPFLAESLGLQMCSINSTWKSLFDIRTKLLTELLDTIIIPRDQTVKDAISLVIKQLARAAEEKTDKVSEWLHAIQVEALEKLETLDSELIQQFDTSVVAVTLVYAAIRFYHGKMVISIAQRDLAELSGYSTALVSKCWIDLFGNNQ